MQFFTKIIIEMRSYEMLIPLKKNIILDKC